MTIHIHSFLDMIHQVYTTQFWLLVDCPSTHNQYLLSGRYRTSMCVCMWSKCGEHDNDNRQQRQQMVTGQLTDKPTCVSQVGLSVVNSQTSEFAKMFYLKFGVSICSKCDHG